MNDIRIKLVIDGKEAVATLQLTDTALKKVRESADLMGRDAMLKQFATQLTAIETSAEAATDGIMDFIKYNELSEAEIEKVISTLREQQSTLAITSADYKAHGAAILNLTNALTTTTVAQSQFAGGSAAARQAVGQFGFALGDAGMIAVDFRMFLLSIGNNIPFIVQGLAKVSEEAKKANQSMGQFLKNSMDASMKMVLGANALMFALQVIPAIFAAINEESDKAAKEGMEEFSKRLEKNDQ